MVWKSLRDEMKFLKLSRPSELATGPFLKI